MIRKLAFLGLPCSILAFLALQCDAERVSDSLITEAPPPFRCKENCINVDHSVWDSILKECTVPDQVHNGIAYNAMDYEKLENEKKMELKSYLDTLASVDVTRLSHNEALAFMINAYNAFTVDIIVEHHPKRSIRDLSSFWRGSVFKRFKHELNFGGSKKSVSLDDVEHGYIRGIITNHNEPRVHSAVNCASVSCPDLRAEAYVGDTIDAQLDDQMRIWMANTGKGLRVDGPNSVYLSRIFQWFAEDFKEGKAETAAKYAPESSIPVLLNGPRIQYFGYDWDLNKPRSSS